jgi:uncharacterized protein YceK
MKMILSLLLVCWLAGSGCMTMFTLEAARGDTYKNEKGDVVVRESPKPGYYALVPLAVTGDVATLPFQLLTALIIRMSGITC